MSKKEIKQLIKNNKGLSRFSIVDNGRKQFTTVNSFGLAVLSFVNDSDVLGFDIQSVERDGYMGQRMSFESALELNDIVKIDFSVVRQSKIDKHNCRMNNDFGYALRCDYGTQG